MVSSKSTALGIPAATALVVANMVGTGVFVSLGYQLVDFKSGPVIVVLWLTGGIIALCGALCYAELARQLPRSGGEYHFLGAIYHPSLGFMAGLLSAIVGFAVPTAITALAMAGYLARALPWIPPRGAAITVILLGAMAHGLSGRTSGRVQLAMTLLKLLLIGLFLISAAFLPGDGDIRWKPQVPEDISMVLQPAFATAVFYVFYSYSGWNAAVYGLEEWQQPDRTVTRSLLGGTLLVTVLYVGLNVAFLKAAPVAALSGEREIAHVAAESLFGDEIGRLISGLFALGLFASVSALMWAGPRVLGAMGRDIRALRFFSNHGGIPHRSLGLQAALAIALVVAGDFEFLISYTQTGLTLCTLLSVLGLIVMKSKGRQIRRSTLAPALIFVGFTGYMIVRMLSAEPAAAAAGILTAIICALLWFPLQRYSP
jgi:APA family basic amino acid/polyamine antiporter